jgi:hypothetical protein
LRKRVRYWNLREEALDRPVWRTGFGSGCGPVVRQTAAVPFYQLTGDTVAIRKILS